VPVLACAVCPACLSVWGSALASLGLGVVLSEAQHHALLAIAVVIALWLAARRARSLGRWRYAVATALGCALLVGAHLAGEVAALSAAGVAALLAAGIAEQRHRRRAGGG